jgi:flavin-dependent dehydrogenase
MGEGVMKHGQGGPAAWSPSPSPAIPAGPGATLTRDTAARRSWDAVVVGAGPAGGAAAARLARAGLATLLVDRGTMPRGKVCGCCLSTAAVGELHRLAAAVGHDRTGSWPGGLTDLLPTAVPLERVCVATAGRQARLPLPGGLVVSRERLDARLVELAIGAGAHWLPDCDVIAIADEAAEPLPLTVSIRAGHGPATLRSRFVVLATGLADHVRITARDAARPRRGRVVAARSRIGLGAVLPATAAGLPAGELVMAVGRAGYCGLVRLDDGRIDVAAAVDPQALRESGQPAHVILRVLAEAAPSTASAGPDAWSSLLADARVEATPPLSHRSPLVAGRTGRIYRVGDAAGYVEPFTGEGIGWGLAGARLLADVLVAAATGRVAAVLAADAYRAAHAAHFARPHTRAGHVARGVRRPTLVAGAVGAARWAPWAARRVVPLLVGHVLGQGTRVEGSAREGVTPS